MSREVRRVPLDWKHPTEFNPYWVSQHAWRARQGHPESKLHHFEDRFVGLMDDFPGDRARWEQELADLRARTGHDWTFNVKYHLTGFKGQADDAEVVHPFHVWTEDGQDTIPVEVRDEDHLHALMLTEKEKGGGPDPTDYMPVWDVPEDRLGWCLYETVSEGTPVTPVFATADELIAHLSTVGQDWDQVPMRREAAETLVRNGFSFGSFVAVGDQFFKSDTDADKLAEALADGRTPTVRGE